MCLNLPLKVISTAGQKIVVEAGGAKRTAIGSLIKVKKGDYVLLQNNFIVAKISEKQAQEINHLIKNK